jgi:outer membrane scaffolding protein for murein synthesis (MipA/OmpV family)
MMSKKINWFWLAIALVFTSRVIAGDLSTDIRKGASDPHAGEGNYVELGLSLDAIRSPYYGIPEGARAGETLYEPSLDLNIHSQYKNWFMEGFSQSLEQFTFGYNFANGERWSLDAVALQQHEEISKSESKDLKGIKAREDDFMSGIRATGYYGNYIVQMHVLTDISGTHDGQVFSLKLARHWQYKNWNFHAIQSESYRTRKVVDYYLSVQSEDASEKFPEFHAQAGFTHTFEIGATYPISQKWVFRTLLRHIELDSQWKGSPLIASGHGDLFINSISYVF